jgi:diguanylate cyclase (GGDEF)-like protein
MPAAPLPPDEPSRLVTLRDYQVLDTPPDPRVEAVMRAAGQHFGVPIAAVSLVDSGRQWFKASAGLDLTEIPREMGFCAHAILQPGQVLVVEDATADPRFADNPLVTGAPAIRFYAGAPLIARSGHALGTLCIIDTKPRRFDPADHMLLADLAQGVAGLLDLHRATVHERRAATHDPLTGLANRALFEPRLAAMVDAALAGPPCLLIAVDLDQFQAVNDRFGHAAGDGLLVVAADRIRASVRNSDMIARLGGDEYAVLVQGPFPPHAPRAFAERIRAALAEPLCIDGIDVPIAASIGVAVAPHDGVSGPALLRAATHAVWRAKAEGRATVAMARDVGALPLPPRRPSLEDDLRDAVAQGQFTIVWQPYCDLRSGQTVGHETLLRWVRPGHGPVAPSVFIPVAETCGLIAAIDTWVLRQACAQAAAWPVGQRVSVNISPHWFCLGDLTELVIATLTETGLDPRRLVVEITERTMIDHAEVARERIAELADLGVRVALDDFGTGYSSLASLQSFAFSQLKLDRSFIRDLTSNPRAQAVARAIIRLGHGLEVTICGEGVETQAQLDFLRAEGCDYAQGYLLGRPTPVPQFLVGEGEQDAFSFAKIICA